MIHLSLWTISTVIKKKTEQMNGSSKGLWAKSS